MWVRLLNSIIKICVLKSILGGFIDAIFSIFAAIGSVQFVGELDKWVQNGLRLHYITSTR